MINMGNIEVFKHFITYNLLQNQNRIVVRGRVIRDVNYCASPAFNNKLTIGNNLLLLAAEYFCWEWLSDRKKNCVLCDLDLQCLKRSRPYNLMFFIYIYTLKCRNILLGVKFVEINTLQKLKTLTSSNILKK